MVHQCFHSQFFGLLISLSDQLTTSQTQFPPRNGSSGRVRCLRGRGMLDLPITHRR